MPAPSPTATFHCDRLRVTLAVTSCAARWQRVEAGEQHCASCSGCPVGRRHAGLPPPPLVAVPELEPEAPSIDWRTPPLGVLPDAVVAVVMGCNRRTVTRHRRRLCVPHHSDFIAHARRGVEARDARAAVRLADAARAAAAWAGVAVPSGEPWAVFLAVRSAAAAAHGLTVPTVAAPVFVSGGGDEPVAWSDHPVGLLPDALIAAVVERSRRHVTRQALVPWRETHAQVWRVAAQPTPPRVAWLRGCVERVRVWAADYCPEAPMPDGGQLDLGLTVPTILEQRPGMGPVALAHHYDALVAHCRQALTED